jgi:hypothetical protein
LPTSGCSFVPTGAVQMLEHGTGGAAGVQGAVDFRVGMTAFARNQVLRRSRAKATKPPFPFVRTVLKTRPAPADARIEDSS